MSSNDPWNCNLFFSASFLFSCSTSNCAASRFFSLFLDRAFSLFTCSLYLATISSFSFSACASKAAMRSCALCSSCCSCSFDIIASFILSWNFSSRSCSCCSRAFPVACLSSLMLFSCSSFARLAAFFSRSMHSIFILLISSSLDETSSCSLSFNFLSWSSSSAFIFSLMEDSCSVSSSTLLALSSLTMLDVAMARSHRSLSSFTAASTIAVTSALGCSVPFCSAISTFSKNPTFSKLLLLSAHHLRLKRALGEIRSPCFQSVRIVHILIILHSLPLCMSPSLSLFLLYSCPPAHPLSSA
mmetsp:Transcript_40585/g.127937  ORF Transcript_40585/g.127937 Transcript_40585/m.127937 type:complete len:300 (-) Transcript_40585:121-1020(-)